MAFYMRLQNLHYDADSLNIRMFFSDFDIPNGGIHIIGGENDEALITFCSEYDLLKAIQLDGQLLCGKKVKLLLDKKGEDLKTSPSQSPRRYNEWDDRASRMQKRVRSRTPSPRRFDRGGEMTLSYSGRYEQERWGRSNSRTRRSENEVSTSHDYFSNPSHIPSKRPRDGSNEREMEYRGRKDSHSVNERDMYGGEFDEREMHYRRSRDEWPNEGRVGYRERYQHKMIEESDYSSDEFSEEENSRSRLRRGRNRRTKNRKKVNPYYEGGYTRDQNRIGSRGRSPSPGGRQEETVDSYRRSRETSQTSSTEDKHNPYVKKLNYDHPGHLIVSYLDYSVTVKDLQEAFRGFEIKGEVNLRPDKNDPTKITAYVKFAKIADAVEAERRRITHLGHYAEVKYVSTRVFEETLASHQAVQPPMAFHPPTAFTNPYPRPWTPVLPYSMGAYPPPPLPYPPPQYNVPSQGFYQNYPPASTGQAPIAPQVPVQHAPPAFQSNPNQIQAVQPAKKKETKARRTLSNIICIDTQTQINPSQQKPEAKSHTVTVPVIPDSSSATPGSGFLSMEGLCYFQIESLPDKITARKLWSVFEAIKTRASSIILVRDWANAPQFAFAQFPISLAMQAQQKIRTVKNMTSEAVSAKERHKSLIDLNPAFQIIEITSLKASRTVSDEEKILLKQKFHEIWPEPPAKTDQSTAKETSTQSKPAQDAETAELVQPEQIKQANADIEIISEMSRDENKGSTGQKGNVTAAAEEESDPTSAPSIETLSEQDTSTASVVEILEQEQTNVTTDEKLSEQKETNQTTAPSVEEITDEKETNQTNDSSVEKVCKQEENNETCVPSLEEIPEQEETYQTSAPSNEEISEKEENNQTSVPVVKEILELEETNKTSVPVVKEMLEQEETDQTSAPSVEEISEQETETSILMVKEIMEPEDTNQATPSKVELTEQETKDTNAPSVEELSEQEGTDQKFSSSVEEIAEQEETMKTGAPSEGDVAEQEEINQTNAHSEEEMMEQEENDQTTASKVELSEKADTDLASDLSVEETSAQEETGQTISSSVEEVSEIEETNQTNSSSVEEISEQ